MKLLLEQMVSMLSDGANFVYEKYLDIDIQKESLPFHVAIVDGISRKDSEAAYRASQQMIDDVWGYITGD
jgi:DNA-binding FadR family transcriptional regulator